MKKLIDAIKNLLIGLQTTGKHFPRKHITLQYPTERWTMPERSRGIVVLLSDKETGELNCTTCLLCERACPTAAIRIKWEKNEKGKRQLVDFVVEHSLCCFCGLCEEACNFAAIKMATKYEFSTLDKNDLIWHKDKLQEIGRDVPYEKPVRKKRPVKPAPKPPETPVDKIPDTAGKEKSEPVSTKAEEKTEDKSETSPTTMTDDKPPESTELKKETSESSSDKPEPKENQSGEEGKNQQGGDK